MQSLLALATTLAFAGVQQVEVALGLLDQQASVLLTLGYLGGILVFYALIRSGFSLRFAGDPGLIQVQTLFGIGCLAWSYSIHGPTRGAVLMIILFIMVYGMFSLSARQVMAQGVFALMAVGLAMVRRSSVDPSGFEPNVEFAHFALFATTLLGALAVSMRLAAWRVRLSSQKAALESALYRISQMATRDELTGLLNRRALLEALQAAATRCTRIAKPMSLALIDLDHFKHINDGYGHHAGDIVLQSFAAIARDAVRSTDTLGRWGGEEFLLLMPDTAEGDGLDVLERIRQQLAARTVDAVKPGMKVTFSAGVSQCAAVADVQDCIERADQAMYTAKHAGRDCARIAVRHQDAAAV